MKMLANRAKMTKTICALSVVALLGGFAYSYAQQNIQQDDIVERNLQQYQRIMDVLSENAENAAPFPQGVREQVNVMMENYLAHNAVVIREAAEWGQRRNNQECLSMIANNAQPALDQARASLSEAQAIPSTGDVNEQHGILASYLMVSAASFGRLHSVNSAYITCSETH